MTRLPAAPYSYMSLFPPGLLVNWCFHTLGGLTSDLWMDKRFFLSQVRYWLLVSLQWTPSWQPSCDWKRPDDKFYRWNFRLYRSRARIIFILLLFISARLSAGCRFNRGNRKLVGRTRHTPTRLHVCWGKSSSSVVFCVLTENCGWRWKATDFLKTSERNAASLLQQFTSTEGSARHHPASGVRGHPDRRWTSDRLNRWSSRATVRLRRLSRSTAAGSSWLDQECRQEVPQRAPPAGGPLNCSMRLF